MLETVQKKLTEQTRINGELKSKLDWYARSR